jgi:hypothetical protein
MRVEEGFDEEAADAGGAGNAVGITAGGHHEAGDAAAFAEDEMTVQGEGGPVLTLGR